MHDQVRGGGPRQQQHHQHQQQQYQPHHPLAARKRNKDPEMFILRGLEKILSDREIKRSYNLQLRKACEDAQRK